MSARIDMREATRECYDTWIKDRPADRALGAHRTWSVETASLLLAGLDPEVISDQWRAQLPFRAPAPLALAQGLFARLCDAFDKGEFAPQGVEAGAPPNRWRASPEALIRWATAEGFELPRPLVRALESSSERRARLVRRAAELETVHGTKGWRAVLAAEEGVSYPRIGQLLREGGWKPHARRLEQQPLAALPWR
jgi:hypothetical protein